jgi:SAM-dependent methyltransferase
MASIRRKVLPVLVQLRIYPSVYFLNNPFKIYEFKELQKGLLFSKSDIILDVGCGTGLQTLCLGKTCNRIFGVDTSEEVIKLAEYFGAKVGRVSSKFLCTNIEQAQFPNDYFDKAFSICVIEHIPEYEKVLAEIHRVLKQGGVFAFSVDALTKISGDTLEKHRRDHHVAKYFSAKELIEVLRKTGFKNVQVYPIFKSDFAEKMFVEGIEQGFSRKYFILDFLRLFIEEKRTKNNEGIFLVAKCTK